MRTIALAAVVLAALHGGPAQAGLFDPADLWCRVAGLTRTLIGKPAADSEVIVAPADVDRQMALAPPALGTMRIFRPPARGGR